MSYGWGTALQYLVLLEPSELCDFNIAHIILFIQVWSSSSRFTRVYYTFPPFHFPFIFPFHFPYSLRPSRSGSGIRGLLYTPNGKRRTPIQSKWEQKLAGAEKLYRKLYLYLVLGGDLRQAEDLFPIFKMQRIRAGIYTADATVASVG